jgi:hypothetical protein
VRIITEPEFAERIRLLLADPLYVECGMVTGPGRSGAIAAVYASHLLHIPYITYKSEPDLKLGRLLVIDTASETGQTLRKAELRYPGALVVPVYREPPRVAFWYESAKPQRYRHDHPIETKPHASKKLELSRR